MFFVALNTSHSFSITTFLTFPENRNLISQINSLLLTAHPNLLSEFRPLLSELRWWLLFLPGVFCPSFFLFLSLFLSLELSPFFSLFSAFNPAWIVVVVESVTPSKLLVPLLRIFEFSFKSWFWFVFFWFLIFRGIKSLWCLFYHTFPLRDLTRNGLINGR